MALRARPGSMRAAVPRGRRFGENMTFGQCRLGFRVWAPVVGAMQRKCCLRGDRGSWTERSAGRPGPGGKDETPGTAQGLDGDPGDLIRAVPAKGDLPQ